LVCFVVYPKCSEKNIFRFLSTDGISIIYMKETNPSHYRKFMDKF
jgi:hypothetical protein